MRKTAIFGASVALCASAVASAPAQAEPQGNVVNAAGHFCGADNVGPEPTCTRTSTAPWMYGGNGPFTIVAKNADGTVAFSVSCAAGETCQSTDPVIPANKAVTISVSGAPGDVLVGAP